MCVWLGPRDACELVQHLRKQLGEDAQPHRHAIQTDDHLRVIGADDVYAIGDW